MPWLRLRCCLYPLGEEIKSGRLSRLIDFLRRAYRSRHQRFVLALMRPAREALARGIGGESRVLVHLLEGNQKSTVTLSALVLIVSSRPYFSMNFAMAPHEPIDAVYSQFRFSAVTVNFKSGGILPQMAFGRPEYCQIRRLPGGKIEGRRPSKTTRSICRSDAERLVRR